MKSFHPAGIKSWLQQGFYLLLLPTFFALHHYVVNYPFVKGSDISLTILAYIAASLLVAISFYAWFKNWQKSFLCTFIILGSELFFSYFSNFISHSHIALFQNFYVQAAIILLLLSLIIFYIKKTNFGFRKLAIYLNLLLLAWLLIEGYHLVQLQSKLKALTKDSVIFKPYKKEVQPDIYVIVLDGYGGKQELKDLLGFDNNSFLDTLRDKGFFVVENSRSNYNFTLFSTASLFSMNYLHTRAGVKLETEDYTIANQQINQSPFGKHLKARGYKIINLSLFSFAETPALFTSSYKRNYPGEFAHRTFTGRLKEHIEYQFSDKSKTADSLSKIDYRYNLQTLNHLYATVPFDTARAKLVYAHLLMPHYPYYFNQDGNWNSDPYLQRSEEGYIGYVQYTNKQVLRIIDRVLATTKSPPVIILMSDHGLREFDKPVDQYYHFMNLNAIYLPGKEYAQWKDGTTNVNQLRMVSNAILSQDFPLLANKMYLLRE
jgi:hypothetical protein